jgi:hypothetical protein
LVEVVKKQTKAPSAGGEGRWEEVSGTEEVVSNPEGLTDGVAVENVGG